MIHDIKEADLPLLQRFYDMANCADASYAMGLKWIEDDDAIGYTYTDSATGQTYLTTYARAIEANFNTDKIIKENCSTALSALSSSLFGISGYFLCKPTTLNNNIDNIDNIDNYGGGSNKKAKNQGGAIKSYQIIMQYFDDIKTGIFDSNKDKNTPNPKKHREAIRALDNIGKNNIRGLYVGIREENTKRNKQQKQVRPKLIGRLATTIIMKDGLWIG